MNQVLDSISSLVIGGMVMLLLQGVMMNMRGTSSANTLNTGVQISMTSVNDILENDFRKMGYNQLSAADSAIRYADSSTIVLRGDFDNNGSIDSIRYTLGTSQDPTALNPRARILYRKFNETQQEIHVGVTRFDLSYFDSAGNQLSSTPCVARPSKINLVKVSLGLESTVPNDNSYASVVWEEMFNPRNAK